MPINENNLREIELYQKKFICIDPEHMTIHGDYNSKETRQLNMQLLRCQNTTEEPDQCESEEVISKFFKKKFLLMLYNQKRFDSSKYQKDSIVQEAKSIWIPVNTQWQQTIGYQISKTHIFLQDQAIDLDDLTLIEDDSIFKVEKLANQPYEAGDLSVVMDITIEMNLNQGVLARTGYTILDVLSDVGGIQSLIASAIALWLSVWNYKHFDNYMAASLFKIKKSSTTNDDVFIKPTSFCNLIEYLIDLIPSFCFHKCFRKNRRMRGIEEARRQMAKEINIVEIIKSRRLISEVIKLLLPEAKLAQLKKKTEYLYVDPDAASQN